MSHPPKGAKAAAKFAAQEKADRTLHVKSGCWYDGT